MMQRFSLLLLGWAIVVAISSSPSLCRSQTLTQRETETSQAREVYVFSDNTHVENIHIRTTGSLLLTTLRSNQSGTLFTIDPTERQPAPLAVVSLPGSTGLTGIATLTDHVYAVSGGLHSQFLFANNSMSVYIVKICHGSSQGTILDRIPVPNTLMMNGMVNIQSRPHILLSADSIGGRILRINTKTRHVDVAFEDPALGLGVEAVPLGVNGIHIHNNYLYFTNSGKGTFARVKIDKSGNKTGPVEVVAALGGEISSENAYDDFIMDNAGNAYVTLHSTSVQKITPQGKQTTLIRDGKTNSVKHPTSATLSSDEKTLYISTGGAVVDGVVYGGQVLSVKV